MTIARKATLFAATAGLTATLAAPAASADAIDDYLAKVPSGQISCEQAQKYYTNASDYNSKKNKALAVATVDPRGPQIRDVIARADEAIARCGLNGSNVAAPHNNPQPAPAAPTVSNKQVIPVFSQAGQPTVDIPVPSTNYVVRVPNVPQLIQKVIAKVQAGDFASLSSL